MVDPAFRQQFELGRASERHHAFLAECIPEVFVGTSSMLRPLVACAAAATALSFSDQQLSLPPWRGGDSPTSRWFSDKCDDSSCSAVSSMQELLGRAPGGASPGPPEAPALRRVLGWPARLQQGQEGGEDGCCAPPSPHGNFQPVARAQSSDLVRVSPALASMPPPRCMSS